MGLSAGIGGSTPGILGCGGVVAVTSETNSGIALVNRKPVTSSGGAVALPLVSAFLASTIFEYVDTTA